MPITSKETWLIYALGGGAGHLTRSLALGRAITRHIPNCNIQILTNSNYQHQSWVQHELSRNPSISLQNIPTTKEPNSLADLILEHVQSLNVTRFIVDSFPRGILGELVRILPLMSGNKVYVSRDLSPRYVERFPLARDVQAFYDLVIFPGESGLDCKALDDTHVIKTPPWLLREKDELISSDKAREELQVTAQYVVAVIVTGKESERHKRLLIAQELKQELAGKADVVLFDGLQSPWERPMLAYHRGIDVIVGAGGYNTVYECNATVTPLVAIAERRLYDRQAKRLSAKQRVLPGACPVANVQRVLQTKQLTQASLDNTYFNGANKAAEALANQQTPLLA